MNTFVTTTSSDMSFKVFAELARCSKSDNFRILDDSSLFSHRKKIRYLLWLGAHSLARAFVERKNADFYREFLQLCEASTQEGLFLFNDSVLLSEMFACVAKSSLIEEGRVNYLTDRALYGALYWPLFALIGRQTRMGRRPGISRVYLQKPQLAPKEIAGKACGCNLSITKLNENELSAFCPLSFIEPVIDVGKVVVLVMQDFDKAGLSHAESIATYSTLSAHYSSLGYLVILKPHPADLKRYDDIPCAHILPRNVLVEAFVAQAKLAGSEVKGVSLLYSSLESLEDLCETEVLCPAISLIEKIKKTDLLKSLRVVN